MLKYKGLTYKNYCTEEKLAIVLIYLNVKDSMSKLEQKTGYSVDRSATGFVVTNKKGQEVWNRKNEAILTLPYTPVNH
jgi:hypothetical protein